MEGGDDSQLTCLEVDPLQTMTTTEPSSSSDWIGKGLDDQTFVVPTTQEFIQVYNAGSAGIIKKAKLVKATEQPFTVDTFISAM